MALYDLAMAAGRDGKLLLHAADCPAVRQQAADGAFVGTMFGCRGLPDDIERHACLDHVDPARSAAK